MNLIERISQAMSKADEEAGDLARGVIPDLLRMRDHQRSLTALMAELATEMGNCKRSELASYVIRRREQAGRFMKCRRDLKMTASDAAEEAKLFAHDKWEIEINAEAHMKEMEMLTRALVHKIYMVQDICNDYKHLAKTFQPQGA